jgi:hypothetical protein
VACRATNNFDLETLFTCTSTPEICRAEEEESEDIEAIATNRVFPRNKI